MDILQILGPRLLIGLFLSLFLFSLFFVKRNNTIYIFWSIIGILVIRDILYSIFLFQYIITISHIIISTIFLIWLRMYTNFKIIDVLFYLANLVLIAGFFIDLSILHQHYIKEVYLGLLFFVDIGYLFVVSILSIDDYCVDSVVIVKTRIFICISLFILNVFCINYNTFNDFIRHLIDYIVIPVSYLIYGYVFYIYFVEYIRKERETAKILIDEQDKFLNFITELGYQIKEPIDFTAILDLIINITCEIVYADSGAILIVDEHEDILKVRSVKGTFPPLYKLPENITVTTSSLSKYFMSASIKIGESIIGHSAKTGKSIFIRDVKKEKGSNEKFIEDLQYVNSVIIVPLIFSNRVLGVISLIKKAKKDFFRGKDYKFAQMLAKYASVSLNNFYVYLHEIEKCRIDSEVHIAADIQKKLIPERLPRIRDISLSSFSIPVKGVSGDYYDVIRLSKSKLGIVICDVAGKGINAALVKVMIRSLFYLIASQNKDADYVLKWINKGITGTINIDHYATISYMIFDNDTKDITYSNAGHLPLLIYRNTTKKFIEIDTEGLPLGVEKTTNYLQEKYKLQKGDIVAFYTDGIIEAIDEKGNQYTLGSLKRVIEMNSDGDSEDILRVIQKDLNDFMSDSKQRDDYTMVMMKIE